MKMFENQSEITWVIENIKICRKTKNLQIKRWVIFHPYAIINSIVHILKVCDLFHVLLKCIAYYEICSTACAFIPGTQLSPYINTKLSWPNYFCFPTDWLCWPNYFYFPTDIRPRRKKKVVLPSATNPCQKI